ncbi:MAG: 16S rRNA (guanine(527)-N(7))-methyltransferase RsmG [Caldilineaceae bacterium]|nr:16S rRNA (guanine(527)-N(7))-methyltransferase RsmG [Caldilineaceae bacterium]MCB0122274.1 16S rRNA (guanine(527)-N(7))-methyltransferase RsmG [Caldilineaceae bacterium]
MTPTDQRKHQLHPPITLHLLQEGCQQLGIPLSSAQMDQFIRYYQELLTWNEKFNLTGITELEEVQTKHFLDSLVSLPLIAEELGESMPPTRALHCIDVGTGAGLPGIPLKLVAPALHWTLLDGTGKKIAFLQHMVDELALTNVEVVQGRAEEIGRNNRYRANYDLVTARAVAPLVTLVEYLLPLVKLDGFALIYKGAGSPQEFMEARKAIQTLGGETVRMVPAQVPFLEEQRFIIVIKKVRPTPNLYPRGQGLARKKPIH